MGPEVAGAAISAGEGLLGGIVSGLFNKQRQDDAQRHAEQMNEQAYLRDISQWERANEYNSPIAQRKRLEAAGISPWSMYGQMQTGEAQPLKAPIADTIKPNYINENLNLGNLMETYYSIKRFQNDNALVAKSLEREALQNRNIELQNEQLEWYNANKREEEYNALKNSWRRDEEGHTWKGREYDLKEAEYKRQAEQFEHEKTLWQYDETGRKLSLEEQRKKLALMEKEIGLYDYRTKDYQYKWRKDDQDYIKGHGEIRKMNQDYALGEKELYFEQNRQNILDKYGVDVKLDHWFSKAVARMYDDTTNRWKSNKSQSKANWKGEIKHRQFNDESRLQINTPW